MGRKSALVSVPKDVLEELGRRYIEQPTLTIDQHSAWLAEKGSSSIDLHFIVAYRPITRPSMTNRQFPHPIASDAKTSASVA